MNNFIALRLNTKLFRPLSCFEKYSTQSLIQKSSVCNVRFLSTMKKGNHKPSTLEKYLLVWMKKFPSVAEVPSTVSYEMMEKTRNWARIKINIIICILTGVACVFIVYSGKQAVKRGESLTKNIQKWHEEENAKK